jgi:S-adenosylmethionine decarboxylase
MAFTDTLFQLGMDLTRSSTTQTEDLVACLPETRTVAQKAAFVERDGAKFAGTHLTIDLFGAERLDDVKHIEAALARCAALAGAPLLHVKLHSTMPNGGVSGVAVMAESHVSVHTWPEKGYAAFDVFVGGSVRPQKIVDTLREAFPARDIVVRQHRRGDEGAETHWRSDVSGKSPVRLRQGTPKLVRTRKVA